MEDMGRCGVNWRLEGSHSYYIKEEQNFLLCLLNDKTGPKLVEKCKQVNVLLGYRCENLREHFLSNRKTSQLLRNHKVNIERHLRRMYRIRNDIVHSGETYYNTNLFIKHLREYVEGIASVVLFRIRMHDVYSLDEALSIIRDSVDVTTEILSDLGKDHNLSDEEYIGMLLNGVF